MFKNLNDLILKKYLKNEIIDNELINLYIKKNFELFLIFKKKNNVKKNLKLDKEHFNKFKNDVELYLNYIYNFNCFGIPDYKSLIEESEIPNLIFINGKSEYFEIEELTEDEIENYLKIKIKN
jgi:hypothetical protein